MGSLPVARVPSVQTCNLRRESRVALCLWLSRISLGRGSGRAGLRTYPVVASPASPERAPAPLQLQEGSNVSPTPQDSRPSIMDSGEFFPAWKGLSRS